MEAVLKSLFLHTKEGEPDEATKAAMIEAGYIPVLLPTLTEYRIISPTVRANVKELPLITKAALQTIANYRTGVPEVFGNLMAKALLGDDK
jgi:hypothetical protein